MGRTSADTPTSAPKSTSWPVRRRPHGRQTMTSTAHIIRKLKTVSESATAGVEDEVGPQGDDGRRHQTRRRVVEAPRHREHQRHRRHAEEELEEPDEPGRAVGHRRVVHQPEHATEDRRVADRIERGGLAREQRVPPTLRDLLAEHGVEERVVQRLGGARRVQDPQQAQQRRQPDDDGEPQARRERPCDARAVGRCDDVVGHHLRQRAPPLLIRRSLSAAPSR